MTIIEKQAKRQTKQIAGSVSVDVAERFEKYVKYKEATNGYILERALEYVMAKDKDFSGNGAQ